MKRDFPEITPIGVDTLYIIVKDWHLESHFNPRLHIAPFNVLDEQTTNDSDIEGNHFLFEMNGKKIYGEKATLKLDRWGMLEFNPYYDDKAKKMKVSTKVTLTVPRVIGPDNYFPASRQQLEEALAIVTDELAKRGFNFSVKQALVKRMDVARTFQANNHWDSYVPILSLLNVARMNTTTYRTGYRWDNTQREFTLYEKGVEIASHYKVKLRAEIYSHYPKNSIRAELRWLDRRAFNEATGMKTIEDVLTRFDEIPEIYRVHFEKELFHHNPKEFESFGGGNTVESLMAEFAQIATGERYWFAKWKSIDWARSLTPERIRVIRKAVKKFTKEKKITSQTAGKQLKEAELNYLQYASLGGTTSSLAGLYQELRDKILAE